MAMWNVGPSLRFVEAHGDSWKVVWKAGTGLNAEEDFLITLFCRDRVFREESYFWKFQAYFFTNTENPCT